MLWLCHYYWLSEADKIIYQLRRQQPLLHWYFADVIFNDYMTLVPKPISHRSHNPLLQYMYINHEVRIKRRFGGFENISKYLKTRKNSRFKVFFFSLFKLFFKIVENGKEMFWLFWKYIKMPENRKESLFLRFLKHFKISANVKEIPLWRFWKHFKIFENTKKTVVIWAF